MHLAIWSWCGGLFVNIHPVSRCAYRRCLNYFILIFVLRALIQILMFRVVIQQYIVELRFFWAIRIGVNSCIGGVTVCGGLESDVSVRFDTILVRNGGGCFDIAEGICILCELPRVN